MTKPCLAAVKAAKEEEENRLAAARELYEQSPLFY
jgi:hypothetical protein